MEVISLEDEYDRAFSEAKRILSSGGVIIYPTDTVYGIGGDARKKEVVERIRKIKSKKDAPLSVLLGNITMVKEYAEVDEVALGAVMEVWPGPTTLILKSKKELPITKGEKIGIRVPEYNFMRKLSTELNMPIVTTSANLSGERPPGEFGEIDKKIVKQVDLAIDGGKTLFGIPSSIIDVVDKKVLRTGAGEILFLE